MKLPEGWKYTPSRKASKCVCCGDTIPEMPGTLRSPSGQVWPLIGNSGPTQEEAMVRAIIDANTTTERKP